MLVPGARTTRGGDVPGSREVASPHDRPEPGGQSDHVFTLGCAAELAGSDRRTATALLDGLIAVHLVEQLDLSGYRALALTLTFAAELSSGLMTP